MLPYAARKAVWFRHTTRNMPGSQIVPSGKV